MSRRLLLLVLMTIGFRQLNAGVTVSPISSIPTQCSTVGGYVEFPWTYPEAVLIEEWYRGADTSTPYIMDDRATDIVRYADGYDASKIEPISGATSVGMKLKNIIAEDAGSYTVNVVIDGATSPDSETATLIILTEPEKATYLGGVIVTVKEAGKPDVVKTDTNPWPTTSFSIVVQFTGVADCAESSGSTCELNGSPCTMSSANNYDIPILEEGDRVKIVAGLLGSGIVGTIDQEVAVSGVGTLTPESYTLWVALVISLWRLGDTMFGSRDICSY